MEFRDKSIPKELPRPAVEAYPNAQNPDVSIINLSPLAQRKTNPSPILI